MRQTLLATIAADRDGSRSAASLALAGQAPAAASAADIPISHHDRVYAAEQFSNTVSVTDPADNKLLGVIRLGEPQPDEFQPALQGAGAGARHGLLARPSHAGGGLDRLELGHLHRHGDQCGEAHHLCRPLAARGVLHAGRQGSLGHRARRELCRCARRRDIRGEDTDHGAERAGHADLLAGRQIRLRLLVVQSRRRMSSPSPTTRSSRRCSRPARSARTSPRRPTANRCGSR